MSSVSACIALTVVSNAAVVISIEQCAISRRRVYAGAVSLVDRNRIPHPSLLRAKILTTTSKLDGAKMATIGAFSWAGS